MIMLNPNTINPALHAATKTIYYPVLFERQEVIASSLADLAQPAEVEPCVIRTIGSPYQATHIRLS